MPTFLDITDYPPKQPKHERKVRTVEAKTENLRVTLFSGYTFGEEGRWYLDTNLIASDKSDYHLLKAEGLEPAKVEALEYVAEKLKSIQTEFRSIK